MFWYFNVRPDEKYVFSRCPKCNNRCYIKLNNNIMLQVHEMLNYKEDNQNLVDDGTIICSPTSKTPHRHSCKCNVLVSFQVGTIDDIGASSSVEVERDSTTVRGSKNPYLGNCLHILLNTLFRTIFRDR